MKLWKNLSNRLDAVADVMAAKPCMQGCVGKTLLSIPRTPGNLITAVILAIGLLITIGRFGFGLGAVTNLDDNNPWGIWIAFDLLCGVALAAGGYVTSSACYLFGMKRYHSAVRPAILTAFLGYAFVVVALLYDVGQPWRLPYPLLVSQGTTSLLFEVGLCVGIYLTVLFIEWSPVGLEWLLGMKDAPCWLVRLRPRMHTIRKAVLCFTIPLTILGVVLSTMHQSSLGALFLIAPSKMHPLWYSPFMPVFFFISSMVAGLSMVIFEGTLSHKALHNKMDETHLREADGVVFGFGRAASFVLIGYFIIKVLDTTMDNDWHYLASARLPVRSRRARKEHHAHSCGVGVRRARHRRQPLQRVPRGLQLAAGQRGSLLPEHLGSVPVHLYRNPDRDGVPLRVLEDAGPVRTP